VNPIRRIVIVTKSMLGNHTASGGGTTPLFEAVSDAARPVDPKLAAHRQCKFAKRS
jgi:hypothetical protein